MIGAWMLYVLLLSSVFGVAARVLERALSRAGWPVRWPWAGAITASVLLPPVLAFVSGGRSSTRETLSAGAEGFATLGEARLFLAEGGFFSPSVLERALLFGWMAASLGFLGVLLVSATTLHRDRRSWRRAILAGAPVFLSQSTGPAVAGFWRPVIVLPAWVLSWEEPLQRLIIAHEREHVRAGDPRLLWGALAALVLTPWNLPLWWQFHRLRLAIEIDCDARVLRGPISRREYGSLLLEVAAMPGRRSLAVAAFTGASLGLKARIRLLARPGRRSGGALGFALTGLVLLLPLTVHSKVPAPRLPGASYLVRLAAPGADGTHMKVMYIRQSADPLPPLPGAPTSAELSAAIGQHHADALRRGIAPEEALWFVADQDGRVLHTGVGRGSVAEVQEAVRAQHPNAVSDHILHFEHKQTEGGRLRTVWLFPGSAQ